ncbi:MAG: FABP family protein [Nitriliruptoraceae bacterium]
MDSPSLHPVLAPLGPLIGVFEGDGRGHYPTIDPFTYRERVSFAYNGGPVLAYTQRTWDPDTARPMHGESGYLRPAGSGRVEFTLAHTFGITELQEGSLTAGDGVDGGIHLAVTSTALGIAATAKPVRHVRRTFHLEADVLVTELWMAYAEVSETHHLVSELHRIG